MCEDTLLINSMNEFRCLKAHSVASHVELEVVHVIIDVGDVPLVGAAAILVATALLEAVVGVLVPLTRDVGEALVHGHMGHHVLVVGHTVAVGESV